MRMTMMKRIGFKKWDKMNKYVYKNKMNMIRLIRSEKRYNERQMTWK